MRAERENTPLRYSCVSIKSERSRADVLGMASLPPLPLNAWMRYDLTELVLRRLPDVRSVLELGAGEGGFAARLARRYDYLGVEPDPHSHARAAERLPPRGPRSGSLAWAVARSSAATPPRSTRTRRSTSSAPSRCSSTSRTTEPSCASG